MNNETIINNEITFKDGLYLVKINQISIQLKRGFNVLHHYNFSKIETFIHTCKEYFKNIQYFFKYN